VVEEGRRVPDSVSASKSGVTGTGTMVTDRLPLGLVWFQDTSLVAVALLCIEDVSFDT